MPLKIENFSPARILCRRRTASVSWLPSVLSRPSSVDCFLGCSCRRGFILNCIRATGAHKENWLFFVSREQWMPTRSHWLIAQVLGSFLPGFYSTWPDGSQQKLKQSHLHYFSIWGVFFLFSYCIAASFYLRSWVNKRQDWIPLRWCLPWKANCCPMVVFDGNSV